jgi:FkbM family methyltransferase
VQVVKTKYLFLILLRLLKPNLVLDVGSLDGSDALRFRRMLPRAKIVSFEANPHLYQKMIRDPKLQTAGVSIINKVASASVADEIPFFISRESAGRVWNKGASSLNRQIAGDDHEEIAVKTTRLDEHIGVSHGSAALWIDVEGASYEVLSTIQSKRHLVSLIHIETETAELWKAQKLKSDVVALAQSMGFTPIAQSSSGIQQDVVFVNRIILQKHRFQIALAMFLTKLSGPIFARIFEFDAKLHRV